jgi:hypothetical protein
VGATLLLNLLAEWFFVDLESARDCRTGSAKIECSGCMAESLCRSFRRDAIANEGQGAEGYCQDYRDGERATVGIGERNDGVRRELRKPA